MTTTTTSDEFDEDEEAAEPVVTIEVTGLSLYTHHGVSEAEREIGQRLVLDLRIEVGSCDATVTDRVEDTVDYGEVCQTVALVAQQRSYKTLERLCTAIADRLLGRLRGRVRCGSRRPSPSRRSRCRCRRSRSRSCATRMSDAAAGLASGERVGYLGLGSNVGDRRAQLAAAVAALPRHGVRVLASSSTYETEPVGEILDQPDFLNACVRIDTAHEPEELLEPARRSSASWAASMGRTCAATRRARSTSTCCCWADRRTRPSGCDCRIPRSPPAASC